MAVRVIRIDGDPILRKKSRRIEKINDRIKELLNDMVDTMEHANGLGLAAPQIGVLRRAVVIDIGEGPIKMINPEIVQETGSEVGQEGCLSVPGFMGTVKRPTFVRLQYLDENGEEQEIEAEDLFARAICHEVDHLDGILYKDKVIDFYEVTEEIENEEEE